jgi:hypothetical protein
MNIGSTMNLERFYAQPAGVRTYKRVADAISEEITALGELERSLRVAWGLKAVGPPDARRTRRAA